MNPELCQVEPACLQLHGESSSLQSTSETPPWVHRSCVGLPHHQLHQLHWEGPGACSKMGHAGLQANIQCDCHAWRTGNGHFFKHGTRKKARLSLLYKFRLCQLKIDSKHVLITGNQKKSHCQTNSCFFDVPNYRTLYWQNPSSMSGIASLKLLKQPHPWPPLSLESRATSKCLSNISFYV